MSSFFRTDAPRDADATPAMSVQRNPWMSVLSVLAGLLLLGGGITVVVGLGGVADFQDTVLGENADFDGAVATAIVGGVAIVLGIVMGTCWLVLGALGWHRRA